MQNLIFFGFPGEGDILISAALAFSNNPTYRYAYILYKKTLASCRHESHTFSPHVSHLIVFTILFQPKIFINMPSSYLHWIQCQRVKSEYFPSSCELSPHHNNFITIALFCMFDKNWLVALLAISIHFGIMTSSNSLVFQTTNAMRFLSFSTYNTDTRMGCSYMQQTFI